jgi:tRNA(fMet)-specific endonuclease VapC
MFAAPGYPSPRYPPTSQAIWSRLVQSCLRTRTVDRSSLDDDELAVASVSVAGYRVGIEMADTASRAAERARALAAITSTVDVLDYTQGDSGSPWTPARPGTPIRLPARRAHDLIIAAHAAQTGRIILSRDAKARFGELPGVTAIDA